VSLLKEKLIMFLALASRLFGSSNERSLKAIQPIVQAINALEGTMTVLSDDQLRGKTAEYRARLAQGTKLDDLLPEAFATVREAARRALGQRPFDVQLIGGIVLHQGKIAEMKTGEGKTLVATLPTYLNALSGKGVHVVTVNDYLAKRDSEWMAPVFRFLGLTTGAIVSQMKDQDRRAAYQADVTYATNNELGFDFLRDNMKYKLEDMVQRPFNFAIVDEVDSILVDEARTPLIISGPSETATDLYVAVDKLIPLLNAADFEKEEKHKSVSLTDVGSHHIEELMRDHGLLTEGGLYDPQNITLVHHANQALRAHKIFARDTDYIVKDGKVVIIDEFTGRMMDGRRYSDGLHQALEAKERVEIQNENQTLASITFQNYFRMYPKLGGMTGTAMTEAAEFAEIYKLGVVEIPTNVNVSRIDHNDLIYKSYAEKETAIVENIRERVAKGQPVLVGTVSIDKSERLSAALTKAKIPHQVLNARYHEQEAFIISQAGRPGAVTIATNMAGRGTDIKLGGNADMMIKQQVDPTLPEAERAKKIAEIEQQVAADKVTALAAGGLYVIGTERHESRRIDNQLRGRSGRQGDPGDSLFFLSLDDDLMRIFGRETLEAFLSNKHIGLQDGEALTHRWLSKALERAQQKVEQQNFEIRKTLLKFDNVYNDQRTVIYEQRRDIMNATNVEDLVATIRHDVIDALVARCIPAHAYVDHWDIETLKTETQRLFGMDLPYSDWIKEDGIDEKSIHARLTDETDRKMAVKVASVTPDVFRQVEKSLVLQTLDHFWKMHLLNLDHLRQGINLRAFAQRDPLNEFKAEAFGLFERMLDSMRESIVESLCRVEFSVSPEVLEKLAAQQEAAIAKARETREDPTLSGTGELARGQAQSDGAVAQFPTRNAFNAADPATWGSTPRNAPCPCNSGKKYKHCHGSLTGTADE
jgi:preprotein translocase subunit SecA